MSEKSEVQKEKREDIVETGSVVTHGKRGNIHCITIIGQIEGHSVLGSDTKTTKYEHVCPALAAVEEDDDIDGLLIMLNTVGGDIEAGLAIAELIAGMTKPTASLILGGGHSIGVPLAVAAENVIDVFRLIVKSTDAGSGDMAFALSSARGRCFSF